MSETVTITIRLSRTQLERLNALAQSTKRSKSFLAAEALAAYLSAQEWQVAAIREALDAADAGAKPVEHEMVMGWLRSWGTEDEQSRPR